MAYERRKAGTKGYSRVEKRAEHWLARGEEVELEEQGSRGKGV